MMATEDSFIRRAAATMAVIGFIVTGSLMLSGGCGSDGPGSCRRQEIRLFCPAPGYAGESCIGYIFDIVDDSVEPPVTLDSFGINFNRKCENIDCFTLSCQDITADSDTVIPEADIIIETVDGIPVGEGTGTIKSGKPAGRIIIDGENFRLEPAGTIVP